MAHSVDITPAIIKEYNLQVVPTNELPSLYQPTNPELMKEEGYFHSIELDHSSLNTQKFSKIWKGMC